MVGFCEVKEAHNKFLRTVDYYLTKELLRLERICSFSVSQGWFHINFAWFSGRWFAFAWDFIDG